MGVDSRHILSRYNIFPEEYVERTKKELRILEEELQLVGAKLERISQMKVRLENAIYLRKCNLAPIQCLPSEILSEIFSLVHISYNMYTMTELSMAGDPNLYKARKRKSQAYLLGVCKKWRDIALRTPALWGSLIINLETRFTYAQCHSLERWLKRSGVQMISLLIVQDHCPPSWPPAQLEYTMEDIPYIVTGPILTQEMLIEQL